MKATGIWRMYISSSGWRAVFFLVYLALLSVASYLGFLAPDSTEYLRIAQAIVEGHGCSLHGHYSAIWPCGYPIAIALFSPTQDYMSLIFASKIANFVFIVTGMVMLSSVIRDYRIVLAATLNPIMWDLVPWTISENLFCFAMFGVIVATKKLNDGMSAAKQSFGRIVIFSIGICTFVIIGYFARYFFAIFAVTLYGATLLAYGRRTALAALPAYMFAAGLFLVLIHYNSEETGFRTGMPRLPAPESTQFLLIYFSYQCVRVVLMFVPVFLILWPEYFLSFKRAPKTDNLDEAAAPPPLSRFLMLSGIGYIGLQFLFRFFFAYDLFTFRLIGPGFVLFICGLALASRLPGRPAQGAPTWFSPSVQTLMLAAYCLVASQTLLPLGRILSDWRLGRPLSARALILNSKAPATSAKVIFSFYRPPLSPLLMSLDEFYYGDDKTIVYPDYAPEAASDTAESYRAKLQKYAGADCVLDFTLLNSDDNLRKELSGMEYDVDVSFSGLKMIRLKRPAFDPSLKEFVARAFEPGEYVPCQRALAVNQTP